MNWSMVLGVILVLYAIFVIYRGRLTSGDDYGNSWVITRSEKPVQFWFSVVLMLAIAFTLIFNIIHF